jgi:hypothetical protein
MALSTGKVAGLLAAVLVIALLAFAAGFLLGLSTAHDLSGTRTVAPADAGPAVGREAGGQTAADSNGADDDRADGDGATGGNGAAGQTVNGGAQPDGVGAVNGPGDGSGSKDGADAGAGDAGKGGDRGGQGANAPAGYQVLAGAHAVEARAHAVARRLSDRGFAAQVVALQAVDGPWFRVVVGGFDSLAAAREAAMQVRTEVGIDVLVAPPQPQAANAEPAN